jgi:hypothetical protein
MRMDLEVLNSVDHIMRTSTRDNECVTVTVTATFESDTRQILSRESAENESENQHEERNPEILSCFDFSTNSGIMQS